MAGLPREDSGLERTLLRLERFLRCNESSGSAKLLYFLEDSFLRHLVQITQRTLRHGGRLGFVRLRCSASGGSARLLVVFEDRLLPILGIQRAAARSADSSSLSWRRPRTAAFAVALTLAKKVLNNNDENGKPESVQGHCDGFQAGDEERLGAIHGCWEA